MNPADWTDFLKGNRTVIVSWITAAVAAVLSLNAIYHWFSPEVGAVAVAFLTSVGLMMARSGAAAAEAKADANAAKIEAASVRIESTRSSLSSSQISNATAIARMESKLAEGGK